MDNYYETNAIYEYLENNNVTGFLFAKGSLWLLLYGDIYSNPKILVAVSAANTKNYGDLYFSEHEKKIFNVGENLALRAGIPFGIIRFCSDLPEIEEVQCLNWSTKKYQVISICKLSTVFERHGILTKNKSSQKPVNDKVSSAFHKWQRDTMGDEIIATDLDLIRINEQEKPVDIYELKRAEKPPFEKWKPFEKDYPNFKLVSNFSKMAGVNFSIVFNRRIKKPYFDDISKLKIFHFENTAKPNCKFIKTLTIDEFIGGEK